MRAKVPGRVSRVPANGKRPEANSNRGGSYGGGFLWARGGRAPISRRTQALRMGPGGPTKKTSWAIALATALTRGKL